MGFAVTLAKIACHNAGLEWPEQVLTESKLAKEGTFCRELNEPERRWLQENRSEEARQSNLLSYLRPDQLCYVSPELVSPWREFLEDLDKLLSERIDIHCVGSIESFREMDYIRSA